LRSAVIEAKLASGTKDFKAAANVLMDSRFNYQIKAMALSWLTSDENIAGIAMQMESEYMGDILVQSADPAAKVLSALCLKKEGGDLQGQIKRAANILVEMDRKIAPEALFKMEVNDVAEIITKIEFGKIICMAFIINSSKKLKEIVLGALTSEEGSIAVGDAQNEKVKCRIQRRRKNRSFSVCGSG
jgi:hypothetical protein